MLQMTFGVDERDVRFLVQKHWDMVVNPDQLSMAELTQRAWDSMGEIDRDRIANASMEAYLDCRDETDAARNELRLYLIEHRFLTYAPRPRLDANEHGKVAPRGRFPERRRNILQM